MHHIIWTYDITGGVGENGESDPAGLIVSFQAVASHARTRIAMSGDTSTLSWRGAPPTSPSGSADASTNAFPGAREGALPVKIIKVCFLSNSTHLGKNFKLVRCEEGWTVRVMAPTAVIISTYFPFLITHPLVLSLHLLNFNTELMKSLGCYMFLEKSI